MLMSLFLMLSPADYPMAVPGWRIHAAEPICFMETLYRDGTYLRIEYHPRQDRYYMMAAHESWTDVEDRERYEIVVDGESHSLKTRGSGIREEGRERGIVYIPLTLVDRTPIGRPRPHRNGPIESILKRSNRLTVLRDGEPWLNLQLSGTDRAHWETIRCAAKYNHGDTRARYRLRGSP